MAVDVDHVEMGHGGIALSLSTLRLHFLQIGPLRIRVNGQHFVRVKLVTLSVGKGKTIGDERTQRNFLIAVGV